MPTTTDPDKEIEIKIKPIDELKPDDVVLGTFTRQIPSKDDDFDRQETEEQPRQEEQNVDEQLAEHQRQQELEETNQKERKQKAEKEYIIESKPVEELRPDDEILAKIRIKIPLKEKKDEKKEEQKPLQKDEPKEQRKEQPQDFDQQQEQTRQAEQEKNQSREEQLEQEQPRQEEQNVDEQLAEHQRQQELDELRQQERLARDLAEQEAKKVVQEAAKKAVVKQGEKVAAEAVAAEGAAATAGIGTFLAATVPIWLPIGLIIGFVLLMIVVFLYGCQSNVGYYLDRITSGFGLFRQEICAPLLASNPAAPQPVQTQPTQGVPTDLVSLVGLVPIEGASDPRVRQCILPYVQELFTKANAAGLDIVLTSAYRAGAVTVGGSTSAHSRGEAVDFALRNPQLPLFPQSPPWTAAQIGRIDRLVAIGELLGFYEPVGNTLDEYRRPQGEGAHVHIEFNAGYCGGG